MSNCEDIFMDELKHFGILGQKWGIRRFENPDGTLTPEGIKRYRKNGLIGKVANIASLGAYNRIKKSEIKYHKKKQRGERLPPRTAIGLTARGIKRTGKILGQAAGIAILARVGGKILNSAANTATSPTIANGYRVAAKALNIFGAINVASIAGYNVYSQTRDAVDYSNNRYL